MPGASSIRSTPRRPAERPRPDPPAGATAAADKERTPLEQRHFTAQTSAVQGCDDEFADWHADAHIQETPALARTVKAQSFRVSAVKHADRSRRAELLRDLRA
jgi:hypothetical protein